MTRPALRNVLWSGFEAGLSAALSFVSAFVIARLVGPAEVGIGAAAVTLHVLLWVAVNALFADPLVQRATLNEAAFSSAFWASLVAGAATALLQLALAQPIADWLGDRRLLGMSAILASPLPLVGTAGPVQGLPTSNRCYKAIAGRTVIGQGLGTSVGIASALAGAGAWALILQQVVASSTGALALLVRSPSRLRWIICRRDLRDLLRIGLPLTVSTLVQHGRYRLFALLIGGTTGAAALGQVHMAFRLLDTVRELAFTAQWRLMLPVLSERQDDIGELHASMDRCLAWSGLLAFPLCCAMAIGIEPLVRLLLDPVWQPSAVAVLPLIGLTAWLFLAFPAAVAVIARGEPRYTVIANIAGTAATAAGVLLVRPETRLQAVLVWLGAQLFVSPYVPASNARVLRCHPLRPLRAGAALLGAMLLAAAAGFALPRLWGEPASPLMLIVARTLIAAAVGIPAMLTGKTKGGSTPCAKITKSISAPSLLPVMVALGATIHVYVAAQPRRGCSLQARP